MSKGFICALAGIAMTLLGWYGPWEWPGWPGIIVLDHFVAPAGLLSETPVYVRAATMFLLIAINVTVWALAVRACLALLPRLRRSATACV